MKDKRLLVVSAHAADYVWRSGGTIAKYIKNGAKVKVVVLSFGVRGESNDLWKNPEATYESVKEIRRSETEAAAKILGIKDIEFWDKEDYPLNFTREDQDRLVRIIRDFRPDYIISHDKLDYLNKDHDYTHHFVLESSILSNSKGVQMEGTTNTKQMRLFGFEPHQTEMSNFKPNSLIDITEVYETKVEAMNCFKAQGHLIKYYTDRAFLRGNHARRVSGIQEYKYAEAFANYFPLASSELI